MKLPPNYVNGNGEGIGGVPKATAYGGIGQKLLEKMGWKEGEGLGKDKKGAKEAIIIKKKKNNLGIGAKNSIINTKFEEIYEKELKKIAYKNEDSDNSEEKEEIKIKKKYNPDGTITSAKREELEIYKILSGRKEGKRRRKLGKYEIGLGKLKRIKKQEKSNSKNKERKKSSM